MYFLELHLLDIRYKQYYSYSIVYVRFSCLALLSPCSVHEIIQRHTFICFLEYIDNQSFKCCAGRDWVEDE